MMVTVIGGSGFIGTRLVRLLKREGLGIKIIDKVPSHLFPEDTVVADIRDYNRLLDVLPHCDAVVNLAAEHRDDVTPRSLYNEVNIQGADNLVRACEAKGITTIVFTSSVAVYGFAPPGTGEDGEINYFNDYGRTKWEAEKIYRSWYEKDPSHRTLVIIRPTVVFGEDNRGNVYNLLRQIASGMFPMVGPGTNLKSMAYVENVAAFLLHMLRSAKGYQLYNYVDKPDFTMNELVMLVKRTLGRKPSTGIHWPIWLGYAGGGLFDMIAALTGKKLPVSRIRVRKFCATTQFATRAFETTGFKPPVPIETGLQRTIEYEFLNKPTSGGKLFYTE
ncbi:MAG: NAD-dependent epimerase/dehydratase family protein [Rectinemataceae bacterium]